QSADCTTRRDLLGGHVQGELVSRPQRPTADDHRSTHHVDRRPWTTEVVSQRRTGAVDRWPCCASYSPRFASVPVRRPGMSSTTAGSRSCLTRCNGRLGARTAGTDEVPAVLDNARNPSGSETSHARETRKQRF